MADEVDRWFYDLGALAKQIDENYARTAAAQRKAEVGRKRTLILTAFVLFAFLLLAWRSEVNADRISDGNARITATQARITATQQDSCISGLEIIKRFNMQQDELAAIERASPFDDEATRLARVQAYEDGRAIPLPICGTP